ncbi:MAG: ribosomal protection-like ABC-F family protein [Bacilli bacterium]
MIEINLNNIVKSFGFKNVLNGFNFEAKTGERIALIGPNGCGKTTIFKIIAGLENINSGAINIRKGATIGLLSQILPKVEDEITVRDILQKNMEEIFILENKMHELEEQMKDSKELDKILKKYSKCQEEFNRIGGYEMTTRMNKICSGFKISKEMLDRSYNTLSGGEKTIVNLATMVLSNPSILLLDEPTNHLDINTLEWFEGYLKQYNGTVIISSHDRYFLDQLVTKIVLIDRGVAEVFHGNYSYFVKENERRIEAQFDAYKNQQKKIEAMKKAIKQLREWGINGDNLALFRRAFNIEKRLERMEKIDKLESIKTLPLGFEIEKRSGKDVLTIKDLSIKVGDKLLFDHISLNIKYGERICLMGENGTGKSTLIKTILNNNEEAIKVGSSVTIGYMPQEIYFDNENETILDVARKVFTGQEMHLRAALAKFLFIDENVYKRVKNLSGGEKVRLKLFELIQKKSNFFILDEPTNHIDINTREILEEALLDYPGTLLFISHDRYFINKLAARILNIENHKIINYLGNYDYYKEKSK